MIVKRLVLTIILAFFYPFSLMQKVNPRKITFISLENKTLVRDFHLINQALEARGTYELAYVLFKFEKTLKSQFLYLLTCVRQLFAMNSSALVLLDFNNVVVSGFKRKRGVRVLQIWHATGAIKKFGNLAQRDYCIKNYDYVIVNAPFFVKPFAQAFNVPIDRVKITGIPETDKLFDTDRIANQRRYLLDKYPILAGKQVVTYAPTFRGRLMRQLKEEEADLDYVQEALGDDYVIIYKPHPLVKSVKYTHNPHIIDLRHESIKAIFSVTDVLVSDFSAIILDYMTTGKPLLAYTPDLEEYKANPGVLIDYETEIPGEICRTEHELVRNIQFIDRKDTRIQALYQKVFHYRDGKSLDRVLTLIDSIME